MTKRGWGPGWGKSSTTDDDDEYEYNDSPKKSGWGAPYKPKPKATTFDKAESEIAKKKATLKHYGIDDPTDPNRDDRNWLERKLNTPKNTGFLGDLFDVLSRGQYASANLAKKLAKDIKEEGVMSVARKSNVDKEYVDAVKKGLTGEERTSYDDVLDTAGMKKGKLRSILGFVGDVGLDPTTYISGGGTALKKVAGKVPGVTKAANVIRDSKPAQVLGKAFIPNFREAGTAEDIWNGYVDLKKGYQNSLQYVQNKAVEDAVGMGKKLTKADRELISKGIQDPILLKGASQEIIDAARLAKKRFQSMAKEEKNLGLLKKVKKDYLPGIYPEKGKSLLDGITYNPAIRANLGKHNKGKVFNTLAEAEKAGLKPEFDVSKLLGIRDVASKRATTTQRFIDDTLNQYGKKISQKDLANLPDDVGVYLPKGSLKFFPQDTVTQTFLKSLQQTQPGALIQIPSDVLKQGLGVSKNVPMYALPKQIAEDLNKFNKQVWDEGTNKALKYLVDKPTNLWKLYATATNPGFHIRNAASNMFQTYLNNGKALTNPLNHAKSLAILASDKPVLKEAAPLVDKLAKLTKIDKYISANTIDMGGKKYSLAEAKELMKKEGILNQGWFDKEIGGVLEDKLNKGVAGKFKDPNLVNPLSQGNILGKIGRYVGGGVEDQARIFNTVADLKKTGGDIKQAKKTTDKYLFDYGDLTDFERNVMKRAVPFYTWLRKNAPLQAEQLIEQPGKYAAIPKAINAVEDNADPVDESYLPEYMENWVKTPFKQSGNQVYLNPNMPYGDLTKLNPIELAKNTASSINPLAKIPFEMLSNREYFFDRKIEDYPGQTKKAPGYMGEDAPQFIKELLGAKMVKNQYTGKEELQVPAKTRYLMKQVPFIENISKSMDYEGDKKFNQLLSFIAGAKIAPYEIEKEKRNKVYSDVDRLRDLFKLLEVEGKVPDDWSDKIQKKKETKKGW